jgi:hypothetical protein
MKTSCLLVGIGVLVLAGCGRSAPRSAAPPGGGGQGPPINQGVGFQLQQIKVPKGGETGLIRTLNRQTIQNDLRQIGLFYKQYEAETGRVNSLEGFKNYVKRDAAAIYQRLQDSTYVIVLNARGGEAVLAYERAADGNGQHIVVKGDGSVSEMSTQELQTALK